MRKKLNVDTKYNYHNKRYYIVIFLWQLKLLFYNIIITVLKNLNKRFD